MSEQIKHEIDVSRLPSIHMLYAILGSVAAGAVVTGAAVAAKKVHDKRKNDVETEASNEDL